MGFVIRFSARAARAVARELRAVPRLAACIFARFFLRKKVIVVSAWVFYERSGFLRGTLRHNNWGDDINVFFLELLSGKKVLVYPTTRLAELLSVRRYAFIGTLITGFRLKNCEICGTGAWGTEAERLRRMGEPRAVHFVRGPLTRAALLAKGIPCPERYGDPALLLPLFYAPARTRRHKIALAPHFDDLDEPVVGDIMRRYGGEAVLVRMRGYAAWTDVIDSICASELVVASSLHALIVAEAYGVPAVWVTFAGRGHQGTYKYRDFFLSLHKNVEAPVDITSAAQVDALYEHDRLAWRAGIIDRDALLRLLPPDLRGESPQMPR